MSAINVSHVVTPLAQTKTMSCWAAASAMLLSWKNGIPYDELSAVKLAGARYETAFKTNTGLPGTAIADLARDLNLAVQPPKNHDVGSYATLLKAHGPLWIGTAIFSATKPYRHVRIMAGLNGDGTAAGTIASVVDPDGGVSYGTTVEQFSKELEEIAKQDLGAGADLNPQVIHFP